MAGCKLGINPADEANEANKVMTKRFRAIQIRTNHAAAYHFLIKIYIYELLNIVRFLSITPTYFFAT